MSESVVQQIEVSMEILKKKVENMEILERLSKNKDFKKLILEGFCKDHALGCLNKSVSPGYQDDVNQKYIKGQLGAVGNFQLYMRFLRQEGEQAKDALATAVEEREIALQDEDEV